MNPIKSAPISMGLYPKYQSNPIVTIINMITPLMNANTGESRNLISVIMGWLFVSCFLCLCEDFLCLC